MQSSEQLIKLLENQGCLSSLSLKKAFQEIDRADFVPSKYKALSYENYPISIGFKQTISQPYTVAFMLNLLAVNPGNTILDIGCGSGYTSALLAKLTGHQGNVWACDIIPELVDFAKNNLKKYPQLNIKVSLVNQDETWSKKQVDCILVSAAAESLPEILIKQLKIGGRLVIPIKNSIWKYEKNKDNKITTKEYFGFTFVPLIYQNN